jgi:acyl carrier protein
MIHDEIYSELTRIFREVFDDDRIVLGPATTADDIEGWDSQAMITLVVAAEARFGISFRTAEIEQLNNVQQFVNLIASKCRVAT